MGAAAQFEDPSFGGVVVSAERGDVDAEFLNEGFEVRQSRACLAEFALAGPAAELGTEGLWTSWPRGAPEFLTAGGSGAVVDQIFGLGGFGASAPRLR